jgi:predicted nuclease of predicted toxin-antitoxin system
VKFLADQNISYRLCALLRAAGHEATHVGDLDLEQADDLVILERARSAGWVIVTADTDFGLLLATQRANGPSVILTREVSTLPASDLAALLLANLAAIEPALLSGAVVAVGPRGIRVRALPLM